ncbi:hypothetical protein Neosp_012848 [[Neocosmospora] mangrovei]
MESLRVLIVGGGIAGPALAHWLSRAGANITLIERSPSIRAYGQQLDLRVQGVPMMKRMGIENAVRAVTVHESGTQLIDLKGQTKAFFPAAPSGTGKQSFTSEYEIMRGDFVRIIYGLTEKRENVKHLFSTTIDSFTQDPEDNPTGKVHVKFHDGHNEAFDLVVAADGTGSRTRKLMLGPDAPDPRHRLGGNIGFFSIPSKPGDSDRMTFCHLPGASVSRIIGTRKDCPELTRVYMQMRGNDPGLDAAHKSGNLAELKKAWSDLYRGGGWECDRFMKALRDAPEADDLYSTPLEEVRLPEESWSKGRVVLLGDAAHSQTANGFGCTFALVGAYVLAGEIATLYRKDMLSPTAAVVQGAKNYEKRYRPIATSKYGGNQRIKALISPRTSFGIWCLHSFARVVSHFQFDQGAGLDAKTSAWKLPDYPELEGSGVEVK